MNKKIELLVDVELYKKIRKKMKVEGIYHVATWVRYVILRYLKNEDR